MDNNFLKYTSRDYQSIVVDLLDAIPSLTDTWTSREDSDPGIVLVKLMSALGDMLSYNFDKQALEYYAPTVTQRKNANKLFSLIGYPMHWYQASKTTVTLTYEPPMPDYITYLYAYNNAITEDDKVEAYYNYRLAFHQITQDVTEPDVPTIYIPPIISETEIEKPSAMEDHARPRVMIVGEPDVENVPKEQVLEDKTFRGNAKSAAFREGCREVFDYWVQSVESQIGLHTYIEDPNRSISLYSNSGDSISYSLIPQTVNPGVNERGEYLPSIKLNAYEPTKFEAIQGQLKSTKFTKTQIKNNRFYLPESAVDEEHMYLSYLSVDNNTQRETSVFLYKTDNLLTETHIKAANGKTKIFFQFGVDDFDYPYIELSSYWETELPEDSITFTLYYFKTLGVYGNITKDYLTNISTIYGGNVSVSNTDTNNANYDEYGRLISSPGKNPETAKDAYLNSLNYIMTYNTLVTIYDFERYTKRQEGITNALAVDNQRMMDLNDKIRKVCDSYTEAQLADILGPNAPSQDDIPEGTSRKQVLADILYSLQRVYPMYYNAPATKEDSDALIEDNYESIDKIKSYTLHMYPVYMNFWTKYNNSSEYNVAWLNNRINVDDEGETVEKKYPYNLYKIVTSGEVTPQGSNPWYINDLEVMLTDKYKECQIVNVEPGFTAVRVFDWMCCGTVHLNRLVKQDEANKIIENIINHIAEVYSAENLSFGQKISYMELIETIMEADERIRYFDAGIGNKKLIYFQPNTDYINNQGDENAEYHYYNIEAYFNSESLMRYTQDPFINASNYSDLGHLIIVDPTYIQPEGSN